MNKRIAINEVCDIYDGPHATPRKAQYGPVYLGINAISENGTLNSNEFVYLSEPDYIKWTKRVVPQCGDIVFSYEATLGRYALIPKDFRCCLGRRLAVIRNRSNKINTTWLYYYFKSPEWTAFIKGNTVKGSTVDRISIEDFPSYTIPLMPLPIQTQIATILSSIDKKIRLNNKISETLQEQASLLYDYWFTQFDFPDENGKPYKSSGGKMVWNEELKREIPDGWMNATFSNLIKETKNGDWGKETCEGNYTRKVRCIRGADFPSMNSGLLNAPYRFILARNSDKELSNGDIIIEISGGSPTQSTGRAIYINETTLKRFRTNMITSNFCKAVSLKKYNFQYWFYLYWKKLYENHVLFGYEGKTTGIKNFLFEDFITSYKIVCPSEELITNFNNTISSTFNRIQLNNIENDKLAFLRDWLLPMLMNGQATVAEEQKPISKVIENDTKNEQPDRFALWLQNQGLAARGDIDRQTLREIFDAMDDDDK